MRNILPEKSDTECEKLFPNFFLKDQNRAYLWISLVQFVFIQVQGYWNIMKLSCRPLAYMSYKPLLRNKKWCGTSLPASLSA